MASIFYLNSEDSIDYLRDGYLPGTSENYFRELPRAWNVGPRERLRSGKTCHQDGHPTSVTTPYDCISNG